MAADFESLAARVESQLHACGPAAAAELLASRRWLSCIDLAAVSGRHHSGSPGLGGADPLEDGLCAVGA